MLPLVMLAIRPRVVAYVENWNRLAAFATEIDYAKVTQLNVAFENPIDDAGTLSANPDDDVLVRKAHARGVKVFLSIGGAGSGEEPRLRDRYAGLLQPARRAAFAAGVVRAVTARGYDGLDVDLEGAAIDGNYGAFVAELARLLHAQGKGLSAALSMGNGGDRVLPETLKALDFVNVMAYDATGPWAPDRPGPHASMAFARASVAAWRARGLPKSKTILGVPFYGHGFGAAGKRDDWTYRNILAAYPEADRSDQAGRTIWYNGPATIRAKAQYVRDEGLAGVMIWSLDSDAAGDRSLLRVLEAALRAGHR